MMSFDKVYCMNICHAAKLEKAVKNAVTAKTWGGKLAGLQKALVLCELGEPMTLSSFHKKMGGQNPHNAVVFHLQVRIRRWQQLFVQDAVIINMSKATAFERAGVEQNINL